MPRQAPTILTPDSGQTFAAGSTATVRWRNNYNLSQVNAQVELTKPDTTTTTATLSGTALSYDYNTTGYASGTYSVRVRTKAAGDADYSSWSPSRSFNVYAAPSISITLPTATDYGNVTDLPLEVGFTYTDADGLFASARIYVFDSSNALVYSSGLVPASDFTESGGVYSIYIPVADLLPENVEDYTLRVAVDSTTGLGGEGTRIFHTAWTNPTDPNITVVGNLGDGCAYIDYGWVQDGSIPVTAVALYRLDYATFGDGDWVRIDQHTGTSGTVSYHFTDKLPLLDTQTTYKVCAFASSGAYSSALDYVTVPSDGKSYFNWGDGLTKYVALDMDLAWSTKTDHVRALYEVIGKRDPVLRATNRRTKTLTATGTVWWDTSVSRENLELLQDMPGKVWFREPKGRRSPVAVTVSLTNPKGIPTTGVQISMTQISGD